MSCAQQISGIAGLCAIIFILIAINFFLIYRLGAAQELVELVKGSIEIAPPSLSHDNAIPGTNTNYYYDERTTKRSRSATSDDSNASFSPNKNKTPRVIFHVGPPKTGTTTIQCSLEYLEAEGYLQQHRIKVVERQNCRPKEDVHVEILQGYMKLFPHEAGSVAQLLQKNCPTDPKDLTSYSKVIALHAWFPQCLIEWNNTMAQRQQRMKGGVPKCWSDGYLKYIHNYHRHQNVTTFVFSQENMGNVLDQMGPKSCGVIFDGLLASLGDEFEIDFIFTYRRYWDLLYSYFGQQYGGYKMCARARLKNKWPVDADINGTEGWKVPTMEEYLSDENEIPIHILPLLRCLATAAANNPRVHIRFIDYHDSEDVRHNFFRSLGVSDMVGNEWIRKLDASIGSSKNVASDSSSKAYTTEYDRIAAEAVRAGLLPSSMYRVKVGIAIWKYFDENNLSLGDFQSVCPGATFYETLFEKCWKIEKEILHGNRIEQLQHHFETAKKSEKFCNVDVEAAVRDQRLKTLFLKLKRLPQLYKPYPERKMCRYEITGMNES